MLTDFFDVIDPLSNALTFCKVLVENVWSWPRWNEGSACITAEPYLLFSVTHNDRVLQFDEPSGSVTTFSVCGGFQNGRTMDWQGQAVYCEHGGLTRALAGEWLGKRLNSPNDMVENSDGSIWFADPAYGIDSTYAGHVADSEIGVSNVYRINGQPGEVTAGATDFATPNGLAIRGDKFLPYIPNTGISHAADGPRHICAQEVSSNGRVLSGGEVFDGFRLEHADNLWASAGNGVHSYAPDGVLQDKIRMHEMVSNVELGGRKRNLLYTRATQSLYSVELRIGGALPTGAA